MTKMLAGLVLQYRGRVAARLQYTDAQNRGSEYENELEIKTITEFILQYVGKDAARL